MALELRQQLKLSQQLIMTPQLQLAIKLLQLSRLELLETIHQELQENPALEETLEDGATDQAEEVPVIIPADIGSNSREISDHKPVEDTDWSSLLNEYSSSGRVTSETEKKDSPNYESFIAQKESLQDHLSWQLLMTFPDPEVENIGSLIIGNLNTDGYLELSLDELILASQSTSEKAAEVLQMMQTFDPIGVCSRDLRECLLIQARHFNLEGTPVADIISNHLHHLERKKL
jgi:RNA polymerase sigma-54 factor